MTAQPPAYTGHVEPNGAPSTRELPDITITKLSVGPMDNNAYLLVCKHTGEGVLIDAANDADRILPLLEVGIQATPLRTVITTHQHWDHHVALPEVVKATGAQTVAGREDAQALPVAGDPARDHRDTRGSVAVLYRDPRGHGHLFTGDSLFPGGPGKTRSPQDFASLMGDLESRVFGELPDDTWVYPGHGDDTTLGKERASLPEWRARGW